MLKKCGAKLNKKCYLNFVKLIERFFLKKTSSQIEQRFIKKISSNDRGIKTVEVSRREINMENQEVHRSIMMDHEMVVDGVVLRERKELVNAKDEKGLATSTLVHSRAIGDRRYVVKQSALDDNVENEIIETDMTNDQVEEFKKEWELKWNPSIGKEIFGQCFKKFLGQFFKKFLK